MNKAGDSVNPEYQEEKNQIKKLGFGAWFQAHTFLPQFENCEIARVVGVYKESLTLSKGQKDIQAQLLGSVSYSAQSPLDLPTVGDFVAAQFYDEGTLAIVHGVLPRKSLLKRKTPGKKIQFQLIAANIDVAFIIQSLDEDFSLRRLERYLTMIYESHIVPVILFSKSDLLSLEEIREKILQVNETAPGVNVQAFSSETGTGIDEIKKILKPAQTYCLLGSSGVGKTTLLNHLMGSGVNQGFQTRSVRKKDHKGRHTTTNRLLIQLANNAMIIDSPGMRELGVFSVGDGLDETFSDISDLAQSCRFGDCSHMNQKECAVLEALKEGSLDPDRYQNFLRMKKESDFYEMSFLEKKKKDKQFGKMIKSVLKHKKDKR